MRCNHNNAKSQYRVVCEDCGIVILPDILDRADKVLRDNDIIFCRLDSIEKDIGFISSTLELIEKYIKEDKK